MATLNNFCLLVVLMASATLLIKTTLASEVLSPSVAPGNNAPGPSSSFAKYLRDCASKLHEKCGSQILSAIAYKNETITKDCCHNLVYDVGKACHENMTKFIIQSQGLKQKETQILQGSRQIWDDCKSSFNID